MFYILYIMVYKHGVVLLLFDIITSALLYTIGCLQNQSADAIDCYSCTNATMVAACSKTVACPSDSVCFSDYTTENGKIFYTLGCRSKQHCPSVAPAMVGRATSNADTCSECCNTRFCNRQLCQDQRENCSDQNGYDCAKFGTVINICTDTSQIEGFCRRFCGLCNAVDGGWTNWSEWSSCDVTCGNGTMTKSRICSDPVPANGGTDCSGPVQQQTECVKSLCPVHGGWSMWSAWGTCSVTCDVGLQRRDRSCSNPYPARYGDHCYGESRDDRLCFPGACANGSWSAWTRWSACSATCDVGLKLRTRKCDNPPPSVTGANCDGDPTETTTCAIKSCYVSVMFYAKRLWPLNPGPNAILCFHDVLTNIGHGYDNSTGYFTAPVNGSYTFDASICGYTTALTIGLFKNNELIGGTFIHTDYDVTCNSLSAAAILKKGDRVGVQTGPSTPSGSSIYQSSYSLNTFRGVRVQ